MIAAAEVLKAWEACDKTDSAFIFAGQSFLPLALDTLYTPHDVVDLLRLCQLC
jgi:hypothetical protein